MNENESLAERLSRFTADGASIDRDALLFAAGRASVRKNRSWMALAGALAASQLATLVLLWPRASVPTSPAEAFVASEPAATVEREPVAPSPYSLLRLQQGMFANERGFPPRPIGEPLVPDEPPLHAFSSFPPSRLN